MTQLHEQTQYLFGNLDPLVMFTGPLHVVVIVRVIFWCLWTASVCICRQGHHPGDPIIVTWDPLLTFSLYQTGASVSISIIFINLIEVHVL